MTRKLFFVSLLVLLAPLSVASPTPNLSFVVNNNTGATLTDVLVLGSYTTGPAGRETTSSSLTVRFGTITNGAAPTKSFDRVVERSGMTAIRVLFTANGEDHVLVNTTHGDVYWDHWQHCVVCKYKYRWTWNDYRIDFYVQKA